MCVKITRRQLLKTAMSGVCAGIAHHVASPFNAVQALAAPLDSSFNINGQRVLYVTLGGGLSFEHAGYYNPTFVDNMGALVSPLLDTAYKLNDSQWLHPEARFLHKLYAEGRMRVMNNVGFLDKDKQSRSHHTATFLVQTGDTIANNQPGVLQRIHCAIQEASMRAGNDPYASVIGLAGGNGRYFSQGRGSECARAFTGNNLASLSKRPITRLSDQEKAFVEDIRQSVLFTAKYESHEETRKYVNDLMETMNEQLDRFAKDLAPAKADFPVPASGFGKAMVDAARLLSSPLNVMVASVGQGGHDVHSNGPDRSAKNARELSEGVETFYQHLAPELADRTVIIVMSEFGRTVRVNSTVGTDHGLGGVGFAIGNVYGGVNDAPSTEELSSHYLKDIKVDVRWIHGKVISSLGLNPEDILGSNLVDPGFGLIKPI